jgi:hypothetical protein
MPVRDSTEWRHAILDKKVINHDRGGTHVMCAWDTCERDSFENYKVRVNNAKPGYPPRYMNYTFCSETHKQYWINNARPGSNNNLPPGTNRRYL